MAVANTLAHEDRATVTAVKSFIVLALNFAAEIRRTNEKSQSNPFLFLGFKVIKLFFFVADVAGE
jgi:hypothetical protein